MSREERKELTALAAWLKTFPEVEETLILHDELDDTGYAWVSSPELAKWVNSDVKLSFRIPFIFHSQHKLLNHFFSFLFFLPNFQTLNSSCDWNLWLRCKIKVKVTRKGKGISRRRSVVSPSFHGVQERNHCFWSRVARRREAFPSIILVGCCGLTQISRPTKGLHWTHHGTPALQTTGVDGFDRTTKASSRQCQKDTFQKYWKGDSE